MPTEVEQANQDSASTLKKIRASNGKLKVFLLSGKPMAQNVAFSRYQLKIKDKRQKE